MTTFFIKVVRKGVKTMKNGNKVRQEKTKNYHIIGSYHLNDKNLSLKAKGLLTYMLTRPDNWTFTILGLSKALNETIYTIKTTLKELKDNNYLVIEKEHKNGLLQYSYILYENRQYQEVENHTLENIPLYLIIDYLNTKCLERKQYKDKNDRDVMVKNLTDQSVPFRCHFPIKILLPIQDLPFFRQSSC